MFCTRMGRQRPPCPAGICMGRPQRGHPMGTASSTSFWKRFLSHSRARKMGEAHPGAVVGTKARPEGWVAMPGWERAPSPVPRSRGDATGAAATRSLPGGATMSPGPTPEQCRAHGSCCPLGSAQPHQEPPSSPQHHPQLLASKTPRLLPCPGVRGA